MTQRKGCMMKKVKSNPEISVIIAMYNAEKFIEECLQSVLNQTMENFEIIVADDCSTDNSVEVVKKMMVSSEKISLIKTKKNSGCAGVPRNLAMKAARGKYIYFLDSDDFIDADAFENLYKIAEEFNADIVHCEKYFQYADGKNELTSWQVGNFVDKPTLETADIGDRINRFAQKNFLWWGCNKLLRKKFLADNKIQFPHATSFEDMVFAFGCVVSAKNYVRVPGAHYHYRQRNNSLSHRIIELDDFMQTVITIVKSMDDFMLNQKFFAENPQLRYAAMDFFVQERISVFAQNVIIRDKKEPGAIYNWLCRDIFSQKPQENVVLNSYLFTLSVVYRIILENQREQIKQLQEQLNKN